MQTSESFSQLILASKDNSLRKLSEILQSVHFHSSKFFVLTDSNTRIHCLPLLLNEIPLLQKAIILEVKAGEQHKNIEETVNLWGSLSSLQANRQSIIINLGGGMVSDLGGFAAAAYKRGIQYINVPTTLLAMVDAAIGGKTAINLDFVKNQIGFFYHPLYTCISPSFLATLDERELYAGVPEMYKTALISDISVWETMYIENIKNIANNQTLINFCAEKKKEIVEKDPFEKGLRKILNFGHSIGHVFESISLQNNIKPLLHGEAVALGMAAELYISVLKSGFPLKDFEEISKKILHDFHPFPKWLPENEEQILSFLQQDKKNTDSKIKMSLLQAIGNPVIDVEVSKKEVLESIYELQQLISLT